MKYMLLIYGDENALTQPVREACYQESVAYTHELKSQGKYISASPLHVSASAKSVRYKDGQSLVTDGPYAETHEQLGGYFMVDVADVDEALAIAKRLPGGKFGTVEVRQVVELENFEG